MAFAWFRTAAPRCCSNRRISISWSFLSLLLSTPRGSVVAFPTIILSSPTARRNLQQQQQIRFPSWEVRAAAAAASTTTTDDNNLNNEDNNGVAEAEATKKNKNKTKPDCSIGIEKFPNAALDKSLIADTIGNSGISKSIPAQIHFPAPEASRKATTVKVLNELLIPDTIGNSGIGKSIPIQIHFPRAEAKGKKASAEALLIPDTLLGNGGIGYSASLIPDTIGNSGISKSIPVQIHFPDPSSEAAKTKAEALLIPDTILGEGGTGFSATLTPDTIGNSGISKSIPVQIHFPVPDNKITAKTLNELLAADTIGNSGIGKSIPIQQVHFPTTTTTTTTTTTATTTTGRVLVAEPLDALLIPDTIGYSGISKSIPAEKHKQQNFPTQPTQSFSRLLQVPTPVANKVDLRKNKLLKAGPGKLAKRSHTTTTTSSSKENSSSTTTTMSVPSSTTSWYWSGAAKDNAMSRCVLPLSFDSHKGSSGRIGVLGGSAQYTGAPYYAAMASLKAGADLAYVFCAQEACLPIKSYSPELMVAPVYNAAAFDTFAADEYSNDESNAKAKQQVIDKMVQEVTSKLERLHVLVIGPGMGRCPLVCEATAQIIQYAKQIQLAMVLDADALWMLSQPEYRNLFDNYTDGAPVVLTPNVVEYKRLVDNLSPAQLESTIIVKKGKHDVIVQNGVETMECHEMGGKKRSGGIGDVLAGTIGTLVAWNRILNHGNNKEAADDDDTNNNNDLALSCWTACCFVKHATLLAFNDKKRSMTAPDVLEHLGPAINEMTDEEEVVACVAPSTTTTTKSNL